MRACVCESERERERDREGWAEVENGWEGDDGGGDEGVSESLQGLSRELAGAFKGGVYNNKRWRGE